MLAETEKRLLTAYERFQLPVVILRFAGIYGPNRGSWLKQFFAGQTRLEGDGSRFLNMIHLEDVVGAILTALAGAAGGAA